MNATSVRDEAYRRVPGFAGIDAALEIANEPASMPPSGPRGSFEELYVEAVDRGIVAAKSGDPLPLDLARSVLASDYAEREAALHARLRADVIVRLREEREQRLIAGADTALGFLAGQLDDLIAAVNATAVNLRGTRTEEEATAAGKRSAAAWRKLEILADTYEEIRQVQLDLTYAKLSHGSKDLIAKSGIYRDSVAHVSYWVERRAAAARRSRSNDQSEAANAAVDWYANVDRPTVFDTGVHPTGRELASGTAALINRAAGRSDGSAHRRLAAAWWPTTDRLGHLIRVASAGLLWLPNTQLLRDVHTAALAMTSDVGTELTEQQEHARAEYYRLIGAPDGTGIPAEHRVPLRPQTVNPWESADKQLKAQRTRAAIRAARV